MSELHALNGVHNILFFCRVVVWNTPRRCALAVFICSIYWQCGATSSGLYNWLLRYIYMCLYYYVCGWYFVTARSVTTLQQLNLLHMTISVNNSAWMRIGPRYKVKSLLLMAVRYCDAIPWNISAFIWQQLQFSGVLKTTWNALFIEPLTVYFLNKRPVCCRTLHAIFWMSICSGSGKEKKRKVYAKVCDVRK